MQRTTYRNEYTSSSIYNIVYKELYIGRNIIVAMSTMFCVENHLHICTYKRRNILVALSTIFCVENHIHICTYKGRNILVALSTIFVQRTIYRTEYITCYVYNILCREPYIGRNILVAVYNSLYREPFLR